MRSISTSFMRLSFGTLMSAALAGSAAAQQTPITLNWNFNGMVHVGEQGAPDDLNGFRSISDRGLLIQGAAGQFGTDPIIGNTGLSYLLVTTPFVVDIVHLGDRSSHWDYELDIPGTNVNVGVQPTWQTVPDQKVPQVSDVAAQNIVLTPNSQLGFLHQISDGGGTFDITLIFTDTTSVTCHAAGPDWFGGANAVPARSPGVSTQARVTGPTSWPGTNTNDSAVTAPIPGQNLSVVETVVSVPQMVLDGLGNHSGKTLASITFENATYPANGDRGYAIVAATHQGTAVADPSGIGRAPVGASARGGTITLQVAAFPASGAPSPITSVTVNGSSINLGPSIALNDNGTDGDAVAGDSLWSINLSIPGTAPVGPANLPFTVTDSQNRTGGGNLSFSIFALDGDLGSLPTSLTTFDTTLGASEIRWVRFTIDSGIDRALGQFLDIDSEGSNIAGTALANNTIMGLYRADGTLVTTDDNDGSGNLSQLTYGLAAPARPAVGNGLTYSGRDGATLAAGTYYLALGAVTSTFGATGFGAASTSPGAGPYHLNLRLGTVPTGVPTGFTDLGTLVDGVAAVSTQSLAPNQVRWFRFVAATDVVRTSRHYLDIDTEGSTVADTTIALYRDDATGTLVTTDNDDGSGTLSQFSYGSTTARPAVGDGLAYNGRDGANTITAATYYLAVAQNPAAFGANFAFIATGPGAGNVSIRIIRGITPPPVPTVVAGPIVNPTNGHSYYLYANGLTWLDAEDNAVALLGGHLASIDDADENEWVRVNVLNFGGTERRGFIGYNDVAFEGNFVWSNGSSATYSNWNLGEPNNAGATEHYAEMLGNGLWNDLPITGATGNADFAIVEVAPPSCPADVAGLGGTQGPDGQITPDDIIFYLSSFFANNTAVADIAQLGGSPGPDGQITADDLVYFLAQFFTPCGN
ncbi:MAG: GC-type dockerin domain-anchored protein [Phycisphaerales bacterium]